MHTLLGVFRSFSLLSVRLLSLLNLNFRAGYTCKSRMCRGIVGDVPKYSFQAATFMQSHALSSLQLLEFCLP